MKLEMKGIQKVGSVVFLVIVALMLTTIIHHQVQEADKLTKTDMCMLWLNGIS
jgi:hypothetical protein